MSGGPKHNISISVGLNQHCFVGSPTVTDSPQGVAAGWQLAALSPVAMAFLPKITVAVIMSSPFT